MKRRNRALELAGLALVVAMCLSYVLFGGGRAVLAQPAFYAIDVFIDSDDAPLAAWQIEVSDRAGLALLTGVEGGEHGAFAEPAHYDPRALKNHRVVLLAYHLGEDCPVGRTRVATLHFVQERAGKPSFKARLVTAAGPDGRVLAARVEIQP